MRIPLLVLTAMLGWGVLAGEVCALEKPGESLDRAGITAKLGSSVDLGIRLIDSSGAEISLGGLLNDSKPLVIVPGYFDCPRLCGLVQQGVVSAVNGSGLMLGRDFNLLSVSFNSAEKPALAATRAAAARAKLVGQATPEQWRFAVGEEGQVQTLMQQLGFNFLKDGEEFAHSAGIFVLTQRGEISQYFTGVDIAPRDLRFALIEASQGRIGSALDHIILFCFRFDPTQGKYTWAVVSLLRIVGALSLIGFGLLYFLLRRASRVVS